MLVSAVLLTSNLYAVDPPPIDSHLFQSGELVYTDGFDGPLNKKWWQTTNQELGSCRWLIDWCPGLQECRRG